jgi:hypothetical protein
VGEGGGGVGGKGGGGDRGEKWPKPCMHIWIIKEKWKKKEDDYDDNNNELIFSEYSLLTSWFKVLSNLHVVFI